ncbi:MAG: PTS glucitol/sorbitol transporter subunit IIA [Chloroflexota bacterium]
MSRLGEIKLRSKIVAIGDSVEEFRAARVLVFFNAGAPEELAEFSVLHEASINLANVASGDSLRLGSETFDVLAVGEVANQNLANLGHLVVKADGRTEPEMLGDVCVEARDLPRLAVGDEIEIVSRPPEG